MKYELNNEFAVKMSVMLRTSLINYKYYETWCEEFIEHDDDPPQWILELAWTKYQPEAVKIVESYAFAVSTDFECMNLHDFYLACLFEKYRKRQIAWADFLLAAGRYSDGNECFRDCEYFYAFLNELEDREYSRKTEQEQAEQIGKELEVLIKECDGLYQYFIEYFQQYVSQKSQNGNLRPDGE